MVPADRGAGIGFNGEREARNGRPRTRMFRAGASAMAGDSPPGGYHSGDVVETG